MDYGINKHESKKCTVLDTDGGNSLLQEIWLQNETSPVNDAHIDFPCIPRRNIQTAAVIVQTVDMVKISATKLTGSSPYMPFNFGKCCNNQINIHSSWSTKRNI